VKKVKILDENRVISASADKTVKIWDIRKTAEPTCKFVVENPIEDFCLARGQLMVAHGNCVSIAKIGDTIRRLNDFYPFQKPATKIRYDSVRDRVIAGGLDS